MFLAGMLTWFVEVLWKAEQKNELVQVIGHVPPGREPECMKTWSKNYFRLNQQKLCDSHDFITFFNKQNCRKISKHYIGSVFWSYSLRRDADILRHLWRAYFCSIPCSKCNVLCKNEALLQVLKELNISGDLISKLCITLLY